MIDVTQLTQLISAFRVETEKESISPETVGKILQDITDLLSTASTEAERKILDDWKAMLSSLIFVYDIEHASGMKDPEHLFLTIRGQRFSNGAKFSSSVPIGAATDMSAGAMSATHVQTIMALQAAVSQLKSSVSDLESNSSRHSQQLNIIRSAGYVVTDIKQLTGNASHVQLSVSEHDVRTGEDFTVIKLLAGATNKQAGVMTAAQVASLETAKTDITAIVTQALEFMAKSKSLKDDFESNDEQVESKE